MQTEECKKVPYETRADADKMMHQLKQIPSTSKYKIGVKPHRSYYCPICRAWHITSMSKRDHQKVNTPEKKEAFNRENREKRQKNKINKEAAYWCKKLGIDPDNY